LANAAAGVSVIVRVAVLYAVDAVIADPPAGATAIWIEDAVTGSLNVALAVVLIATLVAPLAGVRVVTVGAVTSPASVVNDQVTGAIVLPAASVAPDNVTL
jgi:hypothetical protein